MKVISLFSGAGGLDLGLSKAGAKIIWANDIDSDSVKSYEDNIGKHIVLGDIREINVEEIPDGDVVVGGYPCLGFTVARGKSRDVCDEHNFLYLEYLRVVKKVMPKMFLIENVPGIRRGISFKDFFEKMLEDFAAAGYNLKHTIFRAANFGVPQNRDRVIIIGTRKDIEDNFNWPTETHAKESIVSLDGTKTRPWITLKDAISDLPENYDDNVSNHSGTKHKVKINGYVGNRQLDWNKPSPTIMGRGSKGGGPVIHPHPNLKRRLSVRECARIQSFPDDFIFVGSNSSQYAQVGNAVAPLFGFRLCQQLMLALKYKPNKFKKSEWELPWNSKIPEN
jgi:DNA (cytosine-5)-methyltransferase 1